MIFYLLLTYGAKPTGPIAHHPAGKAQAEFFKRFRALYPQFKPKYLVDYARRIDGLESLPHLRMCLEKIVGMEGLEVFVDNVARMFRVTKFDRRPILLAELQKFGPHIYSMLHKKALSDFTDIELNFLLFHPEKLKHSALQSWHRNTVDANAASTKSRGRKAREVAMELQKIKHELLKSRAKVTLQMIAGEAKIRGLRTTRGAEWTAQNVGRSLQLLNDDHQEK